MMTRILQAARNVMKSRVQVVEQTLRCVREHRTGTSDRAQQGTTWIWPCSQKHQRAKEQLRRGTSNSPMSNDECIAGMDTSAETKCSLSTRSAGVGHSMKHGGKPWSRTWRQEEVGRRDLDVTMSTSHSAMDAYECGKS